jgi:hypothetical protein
MSQEDEVPNGSLLSLHEFAMNRSTARMLHVTQPLTHIGKQKY